MLALHVQRGHQLDPPSVFVFLTSAVCRASRKSAKSDMRREGEKRREVPYETALHLEGLDLDDGQGILQELCLVLCGWCRGRH